MKDITPETAGIIKFAIKASISTGDEKKDKANLDP
jgi:hypothetical protein